MLMNAELICVHGVNDLICLLHHSIQTRVVDNFMKNILKYVEEGMED